MKSLLQNIMAENKQLQLLEAEAVQKEIENPATDNNRRNFLKKTALGGITLAGFMGLPVEDTVAQATSKRSASFGDFGS